MLVIRSAPPTRYHVGLARAEVLDRLADTRAGGGAGGFEPGRGRVDADGLGHQWALVALVLGQFAHEVPEVQRVDVVGGDAGVVERGKAGLGEEGRSRSARMLAEVRYSGTGDAWI